MQGELLVESLALRLGKNLRLSSFPLWELALEIGMDFSSLHIVDPIQQRAHDSEGLRNKTANLSRMVASQTALNFHVNHYESSNGTRHPELLIVKTP